MYNVDIRVAPDVILKAVYKAKTVYDAVKFHVSKSRAFDINQATLVSTLLYQFFARKTYGCIQPRIVCAPGNNLKPLSIVKNTC